MDRRAGILALAYTVVAVVGVTVLAVSAFYLWRLADLAGMPPALCWTLPVALDAGAIGATVCWVAAPGKALQWGRGIALGALGGTVVCNILAHLIGVGMMPVTAPLVIGIGAVYPAALWLLVHLALVLRTEQRDTADALVDLSDARAVREVEAAEQRAHTEEMGRLAAQAEEAAHTAERARARREEAAAASPAPAPRKHTTTSKRGGDITAAVRWAEQQLAAGESAGWRTLASRYGLTEHAAKQAAKTAKEQHEQPVGLRAVGGA